MQAGTFERELKPIVDAALEKALRVERDETKGPRFFGSNGTTNPKLEDENEGAKYTTATDHTSFQLDRPPTPPAPPPSDGEAARPPQPTRTSSSNMTGA